MINRITLLLLSSLPFAQQMGLPKSTPSDQIVHHSNYSLNYSEQHEQAKWVAYTLSSSDVNGSIGRTGQSRSN
jgi:endonuclease G, mitochondrial